MKSQDESKLQQAALRWFKYQYPNVVVFSIPNEGQRNVRNASRMKAEGLCPGFPDVGICHVQTIKNKTFTDGSGLTGYCPMLFVEFKSLKGKLSPSQKEVHQKLRDSGYKVEVIRSFDEFKNCIEEYLK